MNKIMTLTLSYQSQLRCNQLSSEVILICMRNISYLILNFLFGYAYPLQVTCYAYSERVVPPNNLSALCINAQ